jgi:heme exporter protein A
MNTLVLKSLTKAYGEYYGLIEVSTKLQGGQITALLGANGAGKSTLIHILSSLSKPTEGEIIWQGKRFEQIDDQQLRADIAFVGHAVMLYPSLTALENLEFFGKLYQKFRPHLDLKEAIPRFLKAVGLEQQSHQLVSSFSRGMLQRLTLARALLSEPKLLLLDEPFTGLDQQGIHMLCGLLNDQKQKDTIILISSHELAIMQSLADEVMILSQGRLQTHQALSKEIDLPLLYAKTVGDIP